MPDPETLAARVAQRIRELRLARKMTQTEAAARAKMATNNWQRIEATDMNLTLGTLERIAAALDVEPADLLREGRPRRKG